MPQVELNSEDLPPIRFADKLSVADEAAPALPPPWSTNSELLAQLQPLVLDSGLVPADEMSLLQLRRLATQARAALLFAPLLQDSYVSMQPPSLTKIAALRWCVTPSSPSSRLYASGRCRDTSSYSCSRAAWRS